jgi:hypothetical protein
VESKRSTDVDNTTLTEPIDQKESKQEVKKQKRFKIRRTIPRIPKAAASRDLLHATQQYNEAISRFEALQQSKNQSRDQLTAMRRTLEEVGIWKDKLTRLEGIHRASAEKKSLLDWSPDDWAYEMTVLDVKLLQRWVEVSPSKPIKEESLVACLVQSAMNERLFGLSDRSLLELYGSSGVIDVVAAILDYSHFIQRWFTHLLLNDPAVHSCKENRIATFNHLLAIIHILHDRYRNFSSMASIVASWRISAIQSIIRDLPRKEREQCLHWIQVFERHGNKPSNDCRLQFTSYKNALSAVCRSVQSNASLINNFPNADSDIVDRPSTQVCQILVIPWLVPHLEQFRYIIKQFSSRIFQPNRHIRVSECSAQHRNSFALKTLRSELSTPGQNAFNDTIQLLMGCFGYPIFPTMTPINVMDPVVKKQMAQIPNRFLVDLKGLLPGNAVMEEWILDRPYMTNGQLRYLLQGKSADLPLVETFDDNTEESSDEEKESSRPCEQDNPELLDSLTFDESIYDAIEQAGHDGAP